MKSTLTIEITGGVASGKSAFAAALMDLCIKYGIPCQLEENPSDGDFDIVARDYQKRLASIGKREILTLVLIYTDQKKKEGK